MTGDMCRLCGHSFLSALGLLEWSDLLDAPGFSVTVLQATGLPVTASSWKLQVSDSERSTIPDSSSDATSFPVAVSIKPPKNASCSFTWELDAASEFEFLLILLSSFPVAMSIPGLLDAIGLFADEELAGTCEDKFIAVDFWFCHNCFFSLLFLHPLRHDFRAAYQAGFFNAASRAEMDDVEQIKKIVPFVTCEITFGQNVCELMSGINVSNLNFRININPVKQRIQSNSVGSWYMSHCGTSAFYYHLNHGFVVLKDIQNSIGTRTCHAWWNVSLLDRDVCEFDCACLAEHLPTGFAVALSHLWLYWFGVVRNEILQSLNSKDRERWIPSMRKPASRETTSATVELCATEVCFLHIQHLMLTLSLQSLLQNQNLEVILICIVVLCFPHNNIACIHMCDECKRSNAPNVCLKMLSILWPHEQVCPQTPKYQFSKYEPNTDISECVSKLKTILLLLTHFLLL